MITLCLTGIWGMKKNTTVWGAVIRVYDVIVPKDIPAVAVEINKSSELIAEKLSHLFLHPIPVTVYPARLKLKGVHMELGNGVVAS